MSFLRRLPLILTFFRLLMGPAFLLFGHKETPANIIALILLVIAAMLTDWLDGKLARKWQAVTALGKLMDPFADALFCMMVFVDFALTGLMWPWLVGVLIAREALVTFLLRPLALWRGIVVAAGPLGKIKTVIQFVAIFAVLVRLLIVYAPPLDPLSPVLWGIVQLGFLGMLCFSLASAGKYTYDIRRALKEGRAGGNLARLKSKDTDAAGPGAGRPRGGS